MNRQNLSGVISTAAALLLLSLTACGGKSSQQQPPTVLSDDQLKIATEFAGVAADKISGIETAGKKAATYSKDGKSYTLIFGADGGISEVVERIHYRFPAANTKNRAIDAAASAAENLVEAVVSKDGAAQSRAVAALRASIPALQSNLVPETFTSVREVVQSISDAQSSDDGFAAAIAAIDLYRRLQEAKDWNGAVVPAAVSFLDHAGFKATLLVSQPAPQWDEITVVATDAKAQLDSIRDQIGDANLLVIVDGNIMRLTASVRTKDAASTRSEAEQLLSAVDLLEGYFDRRYQTKNSISLAK